MQTNEITSEGWINQHPTSNLEANNIVYFSKIIYEVNRSTKLQIECPKKLQIEGLQERDRVATNSNPMGRAAGKSIVYSRGQGTGSGGTNEIASHLQETAGRRDRTSNRSHARDGEEEEVWAAWRS